MTHGALSRPLGLSLVLTREMQMVILIEPSIAYPSHAFYDSRVIGQAFIVCDLLEHAFYVDYRNPEQDYINEFATILDWDEPKRRWQMVKLLNNIWVTQGALITSTSQRPTAC